MYLGPSLTLAERAWEAKEYYNLKFKHAIFGSVVPGLRQIDKLGVFIPFRDGN